MLGREKERGNTTSAGISSNRLTYRKRRRIIYVREGGKVKYFLITVEKGINTP
jgi:hypothetical protein